MDAQREVLAESEAVGTGSRPHAEEADLTIRQRREG
jgi:hypothetical protein